MTELMTTLALSFDLPILDWIQANMQSGFMDTIMPIITLFGEDGIFWIAWSVLLMFFPKTRKIGLGMFFSLALGLLICNGILKNVVRRIRPYDFQMEHFGVQIKLLISGLSDFSFPSGHTIAGFEAATVLLKYSKKMGIPAMIIAILVAFSRLYLYVHYPTDVFASIILGIGIAFIGDAIAGKIAPALAPKKKGHFER